MIEQAHAHVELTDIYDLRATLAGREVALFAGHRAPQRRLAQILSTYYTLVLRHLPDFTPDEWAALAAIFDNDESERACEYMERLPLEEQYSDPGRDPWPSDMDRLESIVTERAEQREAWRGHPAFVDFVAPSVDLFKLAAKLAALSDVQRLACFEKLMHLLHPERPDLVAHDAAIDAAFVEILKDT
ncbi:hypothetical protein [Xanthomonas arboricola]|uniref:hypothetical protein n=1 Tax=Xanthomonas arboricola TaxID=56448 RepID=UPI001CBECBBD|nr:hypothetical protein [Xanthomonas arboricola]MDN0293123.1 hypothetical protein [Xanthomonas arboricola pv. pruni]